MSGGDTVSGPTTEVQEAIAWYWPKGDKPANLTVTISAGMLEARNEDGDLIDRARLP